MHLSVHEFDKPPKGDRRSIGLAHEKPLQYYRVEFAPGPPHQKLVELLKEAISPSEDLSNRSVRTKTKTKQVRALTLTRSLR